MGIFVLFIAIAISAVAAWYSIIGLMAIFSAAAIPIAIMGGVLEVGKLVTASWLYQNWKTVPKLLKIYLTSAVIVLMFITSMGIFGFLSKAHIDQTIISGDNNLEIQQLDKRIKSEKRIIIDAEKVIGQLDQQVQTLIDYDRIRGPSGSIATRKSQQQERDELNRIISEATSRVGTLETQSSVLLSEQLKLEAEVGPIRYVAALVYGPNVSRQMLESAVRWVTIVIIFVFDPLAVLLLIAANMDLKKAHSAKKRVRKKRQRNSNAVKVVETPMETIWEDDEVEVKVETASDKTKTEVKPGYLSNS